MNRKLCIIPCLLLLFSSMTIHADERSVLINQPSAMDYMFIQNASTHEGIYEDKPIHTNSEIELSTAVIESNADRINEYTVENNIENIRAANRNGVPSFADSDDIRFDTSSSTVSIPRNDGRQADNIDSTSSSFMSQIERENKREKEEGKEENKAEKEKADSTALYLKAESSTPSSENKSDEKDKENSSGLVSTTESSESSSNSKSDSNTEIKKKIESDTTVRTSSFLKILIIGLIFVTAGLCFDDSDRKNMPVIVLIGAFMITISIVLMVFSPVLSNIM